VIWLIALSLLGCVAAALQGRALYNGLRTGILRFRAGHISYDRQKQPGEFWIQAGLSLFFVIVFTAIAIGSIYLLIERP